MLTHKFQPWFAVTALALGVTAPVVAWGGATQNPGYLPAVPQDTARIAGSVDDHQRTTLANSRSSKAVAAYDQGALPGSQAFADLTLVLKRSPVKQQAFDQLLGELTNPHSPYFHHWLTASQIGTMYGPEPSDVAKVTTWLQSHGLQVKRVSADGLILHFSGHVADLNSAFNASMHRYVVDGEPHFANANAEQIPTALAPVVQFVGLHNFFPKPQHIDVGLVSKNKASGHWKTLAKATATGKPTSQFTVPGGSLDPNTTYDLAPADFNTVYNVNPLWSQGTRGAGQTVVVLERTDINLADVATFRQAFLPANAKGTVTIQHPGGCADPGVTGDEAEAALDAEWAGTADPDANIVVASCADGGEFGALIAANTMIDSDSSPGAIWSLSYGECEADAGDDTTPGYMWGEAAAEGITVFVSTGDAGSAGCDQGALFAAQGGAQVNYLASSPNDVAVGGTDFNDYNNYGPYWLSTNLPLYASAISYVPEQTWSDSCASPQVDKILGYTDGLTACNDALRFTQPIGGGGGISTLYAQPKWQGDVYGQANFNNRTMPDVSLFAANGLYGHALIYCMSDTNEGGSACNYTNPNQVLYNTAGGTSFAAPSMAGVQALVNEVAGGNGGNIAPALYNLAVQQYGTNASPNTGMLASCNASQGANIGSTCVFNNITVGTIDQACETGSINCYAGANTIDAANFLGVIYAVPSENTTTAVPAWSAGAGYNLASGLGSINVTNLANAMARFERPTPRATPYTAPYDFLSASNWLYTNDGLSDIALVDPVKGRFTGLAMNGSVVKAQSTQSISPGYTIGTAANFFPSLDSLGLISSHLAWTGPDNKLYVWLSVDNGSYLPAQVGPAYSDGWKLMGSEVIDSSGVPQLLWFNASTSQYGWWKLGFNLNTFAPTVASTSGDTTVTNGYVPALADLNGDGYGDLVWTSPSNNSVYGWINNQQGGYIMHLINASRPDGYTLYGAGDFTGSGVTDLVWVNTSTHQLQIWMMDGFNVTSQKTISYTAGYTLASIEDFNGDGLADLLWVGTAGDLYDWQSNGNGGFQSLRVGASDGTPYVVPAGEQVQGNWLQGSANFGVP